MSLIETISNGFVAAAAQVVHATGHTGTVTLTTTVLGGLTWLGWRAANPYAGQRTAPLVDEGAHVTTEILLDGAATPIRIPAAPTPDPDPAVDDPDPVSQEHAGTSR